MKNLHLTRVVCEFLVLWLVVCVPARANEMDQALSVSKWQENPIGRWYGLVHHQEGRFSRYFPVDIEIVRRDGRLFLIDHERGRAGQPPLAISMDAHGAKAVFPATPAGATSITIKPDGPGRLDYKIDKAGPLALNHFSATLSRDPAQTAAFRAPRLDSDGNRVTSYSYRVPAARPDGFPTASAASQGVNEDRLEELVHAILQQDGDVNGPQVESILIVRNGKLILEEYFWGQWADNPHEISSCTKSLTAMITGAAWDRGLVDLEKFVTDYFPDYTDSLWAKERYPITVRHILAMDSGTQWDDTSSAGRPSLLLLASRDIADYMLNMPLVATPGTRYNYDNGLPALQGLLIERATGEALDAFADRTVLRPLGITNYSWVKTHDHGRPLAAGGFIMRPLDAAKLGQVMLDDGMWRGKRILSSAWVKHSTVQQTSSDDYPYSFYWHLTNEKHRHIEKIDGYSAMGQGGQFIMILPGQRTVIVINSAAWRMLALSRDKGTPLGLISAYIVPALLNE